MKIIVHWLVTVFAAFGEVVPDLVICGSTPAVEFTARGRSAIFVCPEGHIGGMMAAAGLRERLFAVGQRLEPPVNH